MNKILVLAVAGIASGCVSQGKFDQLQADHDRTRAELSEKDTRVRTLEEALAQERQKSKNLQAEIAKLQSDTATMLKDKSSLEASVAEMKTALSELQKRKAEADARISEFRGLLAKFQSLIDAGKLRVKIVDGRMVVELATDVLFGSGSAQLSNDGKAAVAEVAGLLATIPNRKFQVEGHTDNVPIRTAQYRSNWELAAGRALTVLKTMVDAGMPPDRISAASFGDSKPVADNATPEGKQANRRIEIVLVPDLSSLPGFDELNRAAGKS